MVRIDHAAKWMDKALWIGKEVSVGVRRFISSDIAYDIGEECREQC